MVTKEIQKTEVVIDREQIKKGDFVILKKVETTLVGIITYVSCTSIRVNYMEVNSTKINHITVDAKEIYRGDVAIKAINTDILGELGGGSDGQRRKMD